MWGWEGVGDGKAWGREGVGMGRCGRCCLLASVSPVRPEGSRQQGRGWQQDLGTLGTDAMRLERADAGGRPGAPARRGAKGSGQKQAHTGQGDAGLGELVLWLPAGAVGGEVWDLRGALGWVIWWWPQVMVAGWRGSQEPLLR